jgi:hypothetical protein
MNEPKDNYILLAKSNADFDTASPPEDTSSVKKKFNLGSDEITREWAQKTYRNLIQARQTWVDLQERAPDLYNYKERIEEIDQQLRLLESWLTALNQAETDTEPETTSSSTDPSASAGASAPPRKILVPDTIGRKNPQRTGQGADDELSDVFFEEEGIVAADLPAESELNVSGRQFIQANISTTSYPNDPSREDQTNVSVDQQLQVRIRGSIADDLLEVQIDYDDSLPAVEQQKTRVFYNGREHDIGFATAQASAKFGDVNLSLPGSTFVSYNKNVFGLSGQLAFSDFSMGGWGPNSVTFYGVASEKKGETQKKEFTGNNRRRVPQPIADINPIRRTYYQPLADTAESQRALPIQVGSETILVDDRNAGNNDDNTNLNETVSNPYAPVNSDSFTGDFDELDAGEDYSINYRTGVIRFKTNIQNNAVIAVSLTTNDGTSLSNFMIKHPSENDFFDRYHLLNRYQLASRNIIRNDPDRVLEIRDPTDSTRPNGGQSYSQLLNVDQNGDGVIDDQFIDFELGVLRFPDTQPFTSSALPDTNPTVYGPPANREAYFQIYQELLVKENTYTLGVNVVRNSEEVTVDGQTLERGQDYTIDYQTGFISFFDHIEIDDETTIEVTYEEQGVASLQEETFVGGRVESTVSENLTVGSTLLTSQEQERNNIPLVGRSTESTTVSEIDVAWQPLKSIQSIIGWWAGKEWHKYPWEDDLKLDVKWDWAESKRNPSQEGQAIIDDFSQLDRQVPFSKSEFDWSPADPIQQFPGPASVLGGRSSIRFEEVDGIGHNPDPEEDQTQSSMRVYMPMGSSSTPDTWASFQQLFSSNGRDLRGYDFLEFWVKWEKGTSGGTLSVDLGQVTENTNRGGLLTEDDNNNQILNPGEDDGLFYTNSGFRFGEDNGQLDSEDLNRNGRLDEDESYLHFPAVNKESIVDTGTTGEGWTVYKIPLRTSFGKTYGSANTFGNNPTDTPTRSQVLKNASMVRLVYESPDASGKDRSFLLEEMGAIQTRWRKSTESDSFRLDVKTSAFDDRLPAPQTQQFREDDRIEKALSYVFDSVDYSDSPATRASLNLSAGAEIGNFRTLQLLFNTERYSSASMNNDTAFIRFGTGDQNYFQYNFSLNNLATSTPENIQNLRGSWYKLSIDLTEFEDDLIQRELSPSDSGTIRRGNRIIQGTPSLANVQKYTIGLIPPPGGASGELLFEGLTLTNPIEESGEAQQVQASINVADGLVQLDATDRQIDGQFRSIGLINNTVANQYVPQDEVAQSVNGSIEINRFLPNSWGIGIPLSFQWSDQTTRIPPESIESVRSENLGVVSTVNKSLSSGLNTPELYPNFSMSWSENDKLVDQDRRQKEFTDVETQWSLNGNYGLTFRDPIAGLMPVGDRLNVSTQGSYSRFEETRRSFGEVAVDTTSREEISRGLSTSFNLNPWQGLNSNLRFNFNDLSRQTQSVQGLITRNQSVNFSLDPAGFAGLKPSFNFSTGINENYERGATVRKSMSLSGNSGLNVTTNPSKWWNQLDFLSLTYRYNINSSASYSDLSPSRSNSSIYRSFYDGASWIFSGPSLEVSGDTLGLLRNRASKTISHSLGGQLRLFEPVDSRYNVNFSQNFGQSEGSVSRTTVLSLSLNIRFRLRQISSLWKSWTNSASFNFNYNMSQSESESGDEITHRPTFQLSTRWNRRWSTNFNLATSLTNQVNKEVRREQTQISPSMNFKWLVNEPDGAGTLWFDNRLELNGSISGQITEATRNGEVREDDKQYSGSLGGAYNITEKVKTRFGGSFTVFRDDFRAANNRNSYGFNASVDFRF